MSTSERRLSADFGARVRKAREAKGLSLDDLAVLLKTDKGNLSRIETGKRSGFKLGLLSRLASALDVSVESLVKS